MIQGLTSKPYKDLCILITVDLPHQIAFLRDLNLKVILLNLLDYGRSVVRSTSKILMFQASYTEHLTVE